MYCKHCGFHSFDHLKTCPKCGQEWDKIKKDLGVQWIEETRGNWLENTEDKLQTSEMTARDISMPDEEQTSLVTAEDDFMLEEDWAIATPEERASMEDSQETFSFENDDEGTHPETEEDIPPSFEQVQSGEESSLYAPREAEPQREDQGKKETGQNDEQDEGMEDLLVPGLEEMLQTASRTTKQSVNTSGISVFEPSSATLSEDENLFGVLPEPEDLTLADIHRETVPAVPRAKKKDSPLPGVAISTDDLNVALLLESENETDPQTTVPASPTAEITDDDIVEINLDDLHINLEEKKNR